MRRSQLIVLLILKLTVVKCSLKFQNLECTLINPKLISITECRIRAVDRTHNLLNIILRLKETLTDLKVTFKFLKRERGGWHPFLYAMTLDLCKYFGNPKKYPLPSVIYYFVKDYTNVNHSCPLLANTDLKLKDFQLDEDGIMSKFPVEVGQYALHTSWFTKKSLIGHLNGSANYVR